MANRPALQANANLLFLPQCRLSLRERTPFRGAKGDTEPMFKV